MTDVDEIVDLPDPAVRPLVHPLDVPAARRFFLTSWLIDTLASPRVGLCVAAVVWFVSSTYVAPVLAAAGTIGVGYLASEFARRSAWAFIPRKRQDRRRAIPWAMDVFSEFVFAVALAAALLLIAIRLNRSDVSPDIRDFTLGAGAAVGALMVGDFVGRLVWYGKRQPQRAWLRLPGVLAVVGAVGVSYMVAFSPSDAGVPANLWWGVATMLGVAVPIAAWRFLQGGRLSRGLI